MRMTDHAVVIAGGGPTGLMLAGELALAGIDVAIVERRASQLARGADFRVAERTLRELMQEQPARLAAQMGCENFAAQPSHIFKPRAEVFGQLLVDLAAQLLREGGTLASGRNSDLQRAPADHGTKIKIAVRRVVHAVGQNLARDGFPINLCVDFGGIGGGDDQINAIEVGDFKGPLDPFETALDCEQPDFLSRHGRDHA